MPERQAHSPRRLEFGQFVDRTFWAILTATAVYVASVISDMNRSISELNQKVAVVLTQLTNTEKRIDNHEERLIKVEER